MIKRVVRSSYSPPLKVASFNTHPSLAKQSFAQECDINHIMGRYLRSGAVDHLAVHGPQYGFCTGETFRDCMDTVVKAEQMFADLSSDLRKKFNNSPREFLEFVQDEKNLPVMRELGLARSSGPPPSSPAIAGAPPVPGGPGAQAPGAAASTPVQP